MSDKDRERVKGMRNEERVKGMRNEERVSKIGSLGLNYAIQ